MNLPVGKVDNLISLVIEAKNLRSNFFQNADSSLSSLLELELVDATIDDSSLFYIGKITTLDELSFIRCHRLTDNGIMSLSQRCIGSLKFVECNRITDAGLLHISRTQTLRSLDIVDMSSITDVGLSYICEQSCMQSMMFLRIDTCKKLTDEALAHVAKLVNLEYLDLKYRFYTIEGLRHLTKLKQLKEVDLHCEITAEMKSLGLPYLQYDGNDSDVDFDEMSI